MHSYLVIGNDENKLSSAIGKLTKNLGAKPLEFSVNKIDDARNLSAFTSLKVANCTAIIVRNIDTITIEAANALLKSLEEPQDNLYYIVTAKNLHKVIPTIVSRCQLIKTKMDNSKITKEASLFTKKSVGEKLQHIDSIRKKDEAISFLEEFIRHQHKNLKKNKGITTAASNIKHTQIAFDAINLNGNVQLHLTRLVLALPEVS